MRVSSRARRVLYGEGTTPNTKRQPCWLSFRVRRVLRVLVGKGDVENLLVTLTKNEISKEISKKKKLRI